MEQNHSQMRIWVQIPDFTFPEIPHYMILIQKETTFT